MGKYRVYEAFTETRVCLKSFEIEAGSVKEAMLLAEDESTHWEVDRKLDEEYSASGFYVADENEPISDYECYEFDKAIEAMEGEDEAKEWEPSEAELQASVTKLLNNPHNV
jgi:hypothetical protein